MPDYNRVRASMYWLRLWIHCPQSSTAVNTPSRLAVGDKAFGVLTKLGNFSRLYIVVQAQFWTDRSNFIVYSLTHGTQFNDSIW